MADRSVGRLGPALARALACALVLSACATGPDGGKSPTAAAPSVVAAQAALTAERKWLQSWFDGTPVRVTQPADGPVTVEVPREFCFDPGRSAIKPPLSAVLEKLAQSLRRVPTATLVLLAAPADDATASPPALQRAGQIRQRLQTLRVPGPQLGPPTATSAPAVQLRLEIAAP